MSFDLCNHTLKIRESIGSPILKVRAHLGVCGLIPSHSPTKKRLIMNASAVFNFFRAIDPYKKLLCPILFFVENLGLLVV
jgi:hypothetical protein